MITYGNSLDCPWMSKSDGGKASPSWVPDWNRPHPTIWKQDSNAADSSLPSYTIDESRLRIKTRREIVDSIVYCSYELLEILPKAFSKTTYRISVMNSSPPS